MTQEQDTNEQAQTLLNDYYHTYEEPTRHYLTKKTWKLLYSMARRKGYRIYCGYHGRNIAILGHVDGWPHVWPACFEYVLKAHLWLAKQGQGLSEDEQIERRARYWEERKIIESSVPDEF